MSNQIRQLGTWGAIIGTAAEIGSGLLKSNDVNYAKTFSKQVGNGKMYLQTEADAYRAKAAQYGLDAVQLAKAEFELGRPLSFQELNILAGRQNTMATPGGAGAPANNLAPAGSSYNQALIQQAAEQQQQQTAAKTGNLLPWLIGGGLLYKFFL